MADEKPDLSQVAEALGGETAQSAGEQKTAAAKKSKTDKSAFDALEKKYRGKGDKEEKKSTSETVSEEPQAAADSEPTSSEGDSAKAEDTPESTKAREFLKLKASAPVQVIDALSPQEANDWATSVAKNEADVQRAFMERSDLQKEVESLKEAALTSEPLAVPADNEDLTGLKTRLSEHFGDEPSEMLVKEFDGALSPLEQRLAKLEASVMANQQQDAAKVSKEHRDRLAEFIPRLGENDRAWAAMEREFITIIQEAKPGQYATPKDAFDEAFKVLYGDDAFEPKKAEPEPVPVEDKAAQIKASTPTTKSKRAAPRKLTGNESDRKIFDHLEKEPGDIRGAQRVGRVKSA